MQRLHTHVAIGGRRHRLAGMGMGSMILDRGGAGGGSSYPTVEDYMDITGRKVSGEGLGDKLGKLVVKPLVRKPKNIKFDF